MRKERKEEEEREGAGARIGHWAYPAVPETLFVFMNGVFEHLMPSRRPSTSSAEVLGKAVGMTFLAHFVLDLHSR